MLTGISVPTTFVARGLPLLVTAPASPRGSSLASDSRRSQPSASMLLASAMLSASAML
jgi:hypothetical protein